MYLLPAITYSTILCVTSFLYILQFVLQFWKYWRGAGEAPSLARVTFPDRSRVFTIAFLIVLERIIDRHANSFILGMELTILKVTDETQNALTLDNVAVYVSFILAQHDERIF